ncbi:hypothetical protein, partial [Yersinia proxima]|uniref:hypothetical protein n=1 Tax=Yersinia proxima TaxID=2890316 RepID=UPI0037D7A1C0
MLQLPLLATATPPWVPSAVWQLEALTVFEKYSVPLQAIMTPIAILVSLTPLIRLLIFRKELFIEWCLNVITGT